MVAPVVTGRTPMDKTNAERQRRFIAKLKAQAQAGSVDARRTAPLKARIAELEAERTALKAQITELHHELLSQAQAFRDASKRGAAKPKAEKAPLPPDEQRDWQIKSLKTRIRNLEAEKKEAMRLHAESLRRVGAMERKTEVAIAKCLHPDQRDNATEADKDEACRLFNAWKDDRKKAQHRGAA